MDFLTSLNIERLDWFGHGVSSVNRTGAFTAYASLAFLTLCSIPKKIYYATALSGYLTFAYFTLQTMSRGALIAWTLGSLSFLFFSAKDLKKGKSIIFILAMIFILSISTLSGIGKRMAELKDLDHIKSNIRTELYTSGLKMLTDAPNGWGIDAQYVYHTWYQKEYNGQRFLSLINSHLQFMAKHGIVIKISYISGWAFIFILTFPRRNQILNSSTFGFFICVFTSAIFSNVLNYWVLWILPTLLLALSLVTNYSRLKDVKIWGLLLGTSLTSCVTLFVISYSLPRDVKIFKDTNGIVAGIGEKKALILEPVGEALGSRYGYELKEFIKNKNLSVHLKKSPKDNTYISVLISSEFEPSLLSRIDAKKIYIFNATPVNHEEFETHVNNIEVVIGQNSDWQQKIYWKNQKEINPKIKLTILPGVSNYIPNWTDFLDPPSKELNTYD